MDRRVDDSGGSLFIGGKWIMDLAVLTDDGKYPNYTRGAVELERVFKLFNESRKGRTNENPGAVEPRSSTGA